VRLSLRRGEREKLTALLRRHSGEARIYRRARIVLLAADGTSVSEIARQAGTSRSRVRCWVERFRQHRAAGLSDRPRSGRPRVITPLERHQVIAAACQSPRKFKVARDVWTLRSLASALEHARLVRAISATSVGEILSEAEIKPHRVRMWCHSTDPDFQPKMRAIVTLYTRAPRDDEPVLCIDEKTGMQALSRLRALQPAAPGRAGRQDFEYRRHGTRCLFACFDTATGRVLARCTRRRAREDFLAFLDAVAKAYPQGRVHFVLDNLNTHLDSKREAFISDWNRRHGGRFVFHYTPTHGSWLNQVELWFGIMSRRVLRHGQFATPVHLVRAVEAFVSVWNRREAHPFRWTYRGRPLVA
jgi:transposase